ncbi:MAG: single-stranded-DNA-specific exonuclease RecJ [Chitinophagaceae bacterium]
MITIEKRWQVLQAEPGLVNELQRSLGISPIICNILAQRRIDSFDKAKTYFRPQLNEMHSPWLMKDMDKAVARITTAFDQAEKIMVYGDYDVDGTTSVAIMYQFLKTLYYNVEYYIPHRYREGYGISKAGIDHASENGVTLIISLDCGIKSVGIIAYAKTLGIDFVVCDHHLPDEIIPDAVAILNAKQLGCPYPYKELCGCGVGLKLIQALCDRMALPDEAWMEYLDLTAIAIAADIVPMTGENRIIAYYGLKKVNENPSTGIKALMELAALTGTVHITNLVFIIAPRVNAAGRMDDAKKAVEMFIEKDPLQAMELAKQLHVNNTDRKEADTTITEEALVLIEEDLDQVHRKSTVLYQSHWHKGVVGIVASRLIDKYYRPTIILTKSGDKVSGSARSVTGFNVYEAIHQCKDLLESYGGHFYAAGLTMKPENVIAFQNRFEQVVSSTIKEEMLTPEIAIDAELSFSQVTSTLYKIICQMEPFGPENLRPVFIARNLLETGYSRIIKEAHIKFHMKQGDKLMEGIGFNMADKFNLLQPNQPVDLVFTLDENEWNGEKKLQLKVIDLRWPKPQMIN